MKDIIEGLKVVFFLAIFLACFFYSWILGVIVLAVMLFFFFGGIKKKALADDPNLNALYDWNEKIKRAKEETP